jgi:hypothetical protein
MCSTRSENPSRARQHHLIAPRDVVLADRQQDFFSSAAAASSISNSASNPRRITSNKAGGVIHQ